MNCEEYRKIMKSGWGDNGYPKDFTYKEYSKEYDEFFRHLDTCKECDTHYLESWEKFNDWGTDLQGIGFWYSEGEPMFVSPEHLVCEKKLDTRMINYLNSGKEYVYWMGYSYCRFECGIAHEKLGCRDLYDGTYIWPEGLVHYIEKHNISLPEFFIEHIKNNNFTVPEIDKTQYNPNKYSKFDKWIEWGNQKTLINERG